MTDKQLIIELVKEYWENTKHNPIIIKAESLLRGTVPVSGADIDASDIQAVVSSVLDGWFTEGKACEQLRNELCAVTANRHAILVNSGSSASLLAMTAVKDKYNVPDGKCVITCATAFPTTIAPIIQNRLHPFFIPLNMDNLGYDYDVLEMLFKQEFIAGAVLTHNLGFPFAEDAISQLAYKNGKFIIADCCDALGSTMDDAPVGTYTDASIYSFFPAHHITTGEGGAVVTNDGKLFRLLQQYSNWGRDCWCEPGKDNTCGQRFDWQLGDLPRSYDHKYTFTKVGYNLKMTEMQGALGLSQIKRLSTFVEKRRHNWHYLASNLQYISEITYPKPEYEFSPFGFPIRILSEDNARGLIAHLEKNGVRTRPIFAGNIIRHPMMAGIPYGEHDASRCDEVMDKMFWVGVWPGLEKWQLDKTIETIKEYYR